MLAWIWNALLQLAGILAGINELLVVAVVITASSLLLYTLTFNLRNRVARSFMALLACVVFVYLGDAAAGVTASPEGAELWLRFQWIGIALTPATYLHFSDALLSTTGRPSRGRRRLGVRLAYIFGLSFVALATLTDLIVHGVTVDQQIAGMLPGPLFATFGLAFGLATIIAAGNIYRAYLRCLTATTRRRMVYLLFSSLAPPLSVFPYLLFSGSAIASILPLVFWMTAFVGNALVGLMLVVMAYSVSFFGSPQPDRVIKARLFQWILRGPLVALSVLAAYVFVRWLARVTPLDTTLLVPVAIVVALLAPQFAITLLRVPLERLLFFGSRDREDVQRIQTLSECLLTVGDVRQFLETVLASSCDVLHVSSGFVAVVSPAGVRIEVRIGRAIPATDDLTDVVAEETVEAVHPVPAQDSSAGLWEESSAPGRYAWNGYWILPLRAQSEAEGLSHKGDLLGLLGIAEPKGVPPLEEDLRMVDLLAERAAAALEDRRLQRQVFLALDNLLVQVDEFQRMRAAASYSGASALAAGDLSGDPNAVEWVRDALNHYWGGPKLTESPLLGLNVVRRTLETHDGNAVNALRAVLRDAIDRVRPDGKRKFTAEWILFNILEMKFLQGRKVRQVALRLAVSEADLYRKQKVALEEVVRAIVQMEYESVEELVVLDPASAPKMP